MADAQAHVPVLPLVQVVHEPSPLAVVFRPNDARHVRCLTVPHTLHLAARTAGQRIPLYGSGSATGVFFHSHLLPSLWLPTRLKALSRPL